jgi:AcrR family transcriptional regulator
MWSSGMIQEVKRKAGRPRNEELRARRQEEILEVATALFAQRGYSGTDLQMVADRLKVGKGTIYRYFPSKQVLFFAATDWGMRLLHERVELEAAKVEEPMERMVCGIRTYLLFFEEHPEFAELLIQERAEFKNRKKPTYFEHRDEGLKAWRVLARQLIDQRRLRDVPVDEILDVVSNLLYGTMFTNFFVGRSKPFEVQVQEILDVVCNGIFTDKERKTSQLTASMGNKA